MPILERISKSAAAASVALIALLLLWLHPDLTPKLRALTIAAIAVGIAVPASLRPWTDVVWIAGAMIAPAVLRILTEREGPVLDLFWMAGLSASLLRSASWSQWRLPSPWRVLAGGWATTLALAWPVMLAREAGFDWRVLTDEGAINSWGMLSAPQVSAWLLAVVWTQLLGLLWLEWAYRQFVDARERMWPVVHGLWISATLASLVAIYQGTLDLAFLSTLFWASRSRATGTLLDANAMGMCAALAGPIAVLALRQARPHVERDPVARRLYESPGVVNAIALLVFVVNIAALWMSGSRAATLCGVISAGVVAVAVWSSLGPRARRIAPWAGGAVVTLVAAIVLTSNAIGPARRLSDIPASRGGLSTIFTRGPYGQIAAQMIREHPIVGVGVGSYQVLSPDYWRRIANDTLPFDNAQNWWRHQLSEFGIVGGLVLFIWSAVLAWHVVTGRARPEQRLDATMVRGLVGAIGISSLIQVPTQTPIVMLAFMLLVAWSASLMPAAAPERARLPVWPWAAVVALALAYAAGHVVLATGPLAVSNRARQAEREYVVGTYRPEVLDEHEFRWTRRDARFVWPVRTRWMVVRVWAHHPDITSQPVHVTLSTPCGVLLDEALRGRNGVSVGVTLPMGQRIIEARLHVSRTWRPEEHGSDDPRELGVAIVTEFVNDPAQVVAQDRGVTLTDCHPGI